MVEKIYCASDHAGFELKQFLIESLRADYQIIDCGTHSPDSVDYPLFAQKLCQAMGDNDQERGILICGSGIGITIAANRFAHIRAALVHNQRLATLCREHNNANVIGFGAQFISPNDALVCVLTFLSVPFAADHPRHARRVAMLGH